MLQKSDLLILLSEIEDSGINVDEYKSKLFTSSAPFDVVKFISEKRELDIQNFYEKIRKSYNSKHSTLYINIMKELAVDDVETVVSTLSSYSLQTILYMSKSKNKQLFLRQARYKEVQECLLDYATTFNLMNCINLLKLIKADIKAMNYIAGREDIEGNLIKK